MVWKCWWMWTFPDQMQRKKSLSTKEIRWNFITTRRVPKKPINTRYWLFTPWWTSSIWWTCRKTKAWSAICLMAVRMFTSLIGATRRQTIATWPWGIISMATSTGVWILWPSGIMCRRLTCWGFAKAEPSVWFIQPSTRVRSKTWSPWLRRWIFPPMTVCFSSGASIWTWIKSLKPTAMWAAILWTPVFSCWNRMSSWWTSMWT